MSLRAALLFGLVAATAACAGRAPQAAAPSAEGYLEAAKRVSALRRGQEPFTDEIAVELEAPYLPGGLRARGAVAVRPETRELRMILLGPGGTTALDVWIGRERYVMTIPAQDRTKAGALTDAPETRRGLPVDFLSWWLFQPGEGEVLFGQRTERGFSAWLRQGQRITELGFGPGEQLAARRVSWSSAPEGGVLDEETLSATSLGCGQATYHQKSINLTVRIECLGRRPGARDAAFTPPEAR